MTPDYQVIIIGGSFAGLSAAMTLGRSLRKTLVIDAGEPCNRRVEHAHNIITHDGDSPARINEIAKNKLKEYLDVSFENDFVVDVKRKNDFFEVVTRSGKSFSSRKILLSTGLHDEMPAIEGFEECWTVSIFHCPYCHGYEVRDQKLALFGNGDLGFEFVRMLRNWSKDLALFTNGESTLSPEQEVALKERNVPVHTSPIEYLHHENGMIREIRMIDGKSVKVDAVFAKPALGQTSNLPVQLGCAINEHGLIIVDEFNHTNVKGIYAAGDCTSMFRALTIAMASGTKAGAIINRELGEEDFEKMS